MNKNVKQVIEWCQDNDIIRGKNDSHIEISREDSLFASMQEQSLQTDG